MRDWKYKYKEHKNSARQRGIEFLLSFDEWMLIWEKSGHKEQRGRCAGQYVMARFGDKGPYSKDNVEIILVEENSRQACLGRVVVWTAKARANAAAALLGKKHTPERRKNESIAHTGLKQSRKTVEKRKRSVEKYWSDPKRHKEWSDRMQNVWTESKKQEHSKRMRDWWKTRRE